DVRRVLLQKPRRRRGRRWRHRDGGSSLLVETLQDRHRGAPTGRLPGEQDHAGTPAQDLECEGPLGFGGRGCPRRHQGRRGPNPEQEEREDLRPQGSRPIPRHRAFSRYGGVPRSVEARERLHRPSATRWPCDGHVGRGRLRCGRRPRLSIPTGSDGRRFRFDGSPRCGTMASVARIIAYPVPHWPAGRGRIRGRNVRLTSLNSMSPRGGESMTDWTVAFAVFGMFALLGGIGALASSFQPANVSKDITIPAGRESYIGYAFSLLVGGTASGSFAVLTGGGGASMNVMTDAQYRAWIEGRPSETLPAGSTSGSFGQFNVPLPGTDTFHLVFTHDLGYESRQQVIHVVFMVS